MDKKIFLFAGRELTKCGCGGESGHLPDSPSPGGINPNVDLYKLHWADIPYSLTSNLSEPVTIYKHTEIKLDVAFTQKDVNIPGCWLAIPFALSLPELSSPGHLPPGEYEIEVTVTCSTGKGQRKRYRLTSPQNWDGLDMDEIRG